MKRLVFVLLAIFLCVALIFGGYLAWRYFQNGEKPTATIIFPERSVILESGDRITVSVNAEAEAGISHLVLIVDDEVYVEESASGENALTFFIPWYATSLGSHTLEALVYDNANQVSEPASLLIGVRANLEPDRMDFLYIPPAEGGDGGAGDAETGGVDSALGQIVPLGDNGEILGEPLSPDEVGGQDDIPTLDENDFAGNPLTDEDINALQNSQDEIPTIAAFDVQPSRTGQGVQIAYHVEARDDLGVFQLVVSVENRLTGEGSSRTLICSDNPVCAADDVYTFSGEGNWMISAFAVDTSGQTSETLVEFIEIVGGDNALLPAIVLHDPATIIGLFDERAQGNGDGNFRIGEVLQQQACYTMSVDQQADGNLITLTYNCTIETPYEDTHYSFEVGRDNLHDPRRFMVFQEYYPGKKVIHAGESFTFLDENANCGANVEYSASGWWVFDDEPRNWINVVGSGKESVAVADCTNDDLQITDFVASINSSGTATLAWNIAQNPNWPSGDISFDIVRYQPPRGSGNILFEEALFKGEWVQAESMDFTRFDQDVVCDTDYFYTLNLYQGPFSEPDSHLATAYTQLTDFECSGEVVDIALELRPGFIYDTEFAQEWQIAERPHPLSVPVIRSEVILPSNFAWPEGSEYKFVLQIDPLETLVGQPSEHWTEQTINVNQLTPRNLAYNMTRVQCGGIEYTFNVYLFVDGVQKNKSQPTTLKSPPCLPTYDMIPDITRLNGYNCGDIYCADIDYSPVSLESQDQNLEYFSADTIEIFRKIGVKSFAFGHVPEEMDPDQLTILPLVSSQQNVVDTDLMCTPTANDNLRYKYRIVGGVTLDSGQTLYGAYGGSRGYIPVPVCGETYNAIGEIVH